MNKEEYYSRMGKIDGKISTDRCSFDEIHNLTIQKNYLNKQYINNLENNWNELKKWLEEYYDYGDCLKIKFILNKMSELERGEE